MADEEKDVFEGNALDHMMKSRNLKTLEEVQYHRIVDRQNKRRSRKKATKGDEDNPKDLLEWVGYYKQNEDSKTILKKRSVEMFSRCEELERNTVRDDTENDDDEENSEECTCDYDVNCPVCTAVLEDEKCLQDDYEWTAQDESAENAEYKAQEKKIRTEKRQEMIRKSKIPVAALSERELCEYEKIREDIINEHRREWAKLEAKWDTENE